MIDLHLHLDGSLNPENVLHMAEMSGIDIGCSMNELNKMLMVEPDCTNLGEYLEKFELPLRLLQIKECIEYAVYELMKKIDSQGLCYAEIRFAPQLHMQRGLSQEEIVKAALSGLERGNRELAVSAKLILCCMRGDDNMSKNMETVEVAEKYLGKGVCAVDLAGNEAAYPTENFENIFKAAVEKGIPVTIHAGEAAGPLSVRKALELGAVRIGHGIHSAEDEELMNMLARENIYLEMCYSSNLQTKAVDSPEKYPIKKFMEKGIHITLNTDNMTVSGTTLKKEYQLIGNRFMMSDAELLELALNSVRAAFLSDSEKEVLKEKITGEFADWINGRK